MFKNNDAVLTRFFILLVFADMKTKKQTRAETDELPRYFGFIIRRTSHGTYMADNCARNVRRRKCFDTIVEAKTWAEIQATDLKNHGLAAINLSDACRRDAVSALEILNGSATLAAAAREYVRLHPQRNAESLSWSCWRYLRQLYREGARPVTIKNARWKLRLWCKSEGKRVTASITRAEVDAWIEAKGYKGQSRRGYERQLRAVLSFFAGTRKRRELADATPPAIFTPQEVDRLFRSAEQHKQNMVAPLALLFFCGLRPHEVMRLKWDNINLSDAEIVVPAEASKIRQSRTVKLEPVALKWLAAFRGSGKVAPGQYEFRRLREGIMTLAKIDTWPPDAARHTYASAMYAMRNDAAYVASQLGHFGSLGIFARHYKAVMRRTDAERFWSIEPRNENNIIQLSKTG